MKIGLISDTHGFMDPALFGYLEACDEIWHAGDLGENVAKPLSNFKPLRAVHGNIDDRSTRIEFPENQQFECQGLQILITHIAGTPPRFNPRVKKLLEAGKTDILICGHSHLVQAKRFPLNLSHATTDLLFLNPGAAGQQGFHRMRTIMRLEINNARVSNLEVIELGRRGAIPAAPSR